jgi:ketosteroid isomerase-like protein
MKVRAPLMLLLALAALAPAHAAAGMNEASARAAILARFDAALHGDVAALDRLLADDLDYCSFRGTCETKRQYVDSVKTGLLKYRSIDPTIERVKMFADSAAVLGHVSVTATRDGVERSIRVSFLGLLAWRDSRWQLTTWTSTLIDETAK